MHSYRRYSTLPQMTASVCAFVALAAVIDSGGLVSWAQRLDLGLERTIAVPVTASVQKVMRWTRLDRMRHAELVELARVGWSDDPAALAQAHPVDEEIIPKDHGAAFAPHQPHAPDGLIVPLTPKLRPPLRPMAGDPPLLSRLPELPPVEAGKTRTIALAGDSMMAVGLSSTLLRELPKYKDLVLVKAFKSGTGLARPEVFNWQSEYPAMLKDAHPDVVLVAIGANDGQGFVEDGVVYPFGTDGWKKIYQQRVQDYLDLLEADGATVVWLGLPPMKSETYNDHIALVNRLDYAVVSASPHAIWFSTTGIVGDPYGRFQDYGEVRGRITRLRQGDGIHLSDDGAVLIVEEVLPWLAAQNATDSTVSPVPKP